MYSLHKIWGAVPLFLLVFSLLSCQSTAPATSTEDAAKPVILMVSFGTSYNDTREKTIGAIEAAVAEAYPAYTVRRAFTSQTIIDRVYQRDGVKIDNVSQAMERLVAEGVQEVVVQPTHLMQGIEEKEMRAQIQTFENKFKHIRYGKPVLADDDDYTNLVRILKEGAAQYDNPETAIVFMGHGTEDAANADYARLADLFREQGYANYFIGTVEAEPSLDDVIAQVREAGLQNILLLPLMIVAGDHANNDMAGDEEDSWKSILTAEGFAVQAVLKGLGEYPALQAHMVRHVAAALQ